ncbi:MAG: hypothetical protein ACRDIC_23035 [bacterium]
MQEEFPEWKAYHFDLIYDETQTVLIVGMFFVPSTPGKGRMFIERGYVARLAKERYAFWRPQEEDKQENGSTGAPYH